MRSVRVPGSLRCTAGSGQHSTGPLPSRKDGKAATLATAVLLTAASPVTLAIAQGTQGTQLPPVSVETTQAKRKAKAPPKKARTQPVQPPSGNAKGANPYADPWAPYKVDKSASGKLTEPLVDTPRTVTAVPKEVLEDKGSKDLRDLARSVAGLTIGSAEGGNAYGAFAIRGFKANNDIFIDSIRNPGNLIPDAFFVQQMEIYKGPSGGIAGRNTIGGAVNIISKQPDLTSNFYEVTNTIGTDHTLRTVLDVNRVLSPYVAVRANIMYDQHDVAGRDFADSERWGGLISATYRPSDSFKLAIDYLRYRNNATPDWGVPVRDIDDVPVTELGVPGVKRSLWVGMAGLDFFKERADIVTATAVSKLTDGMTLTNRLRAGESEVDYVATSMEGYPDVHHPNRDQIARIFASQTELNIKFNSGIFFHNIVFGVELSREEIDRYGYNVTNCFDGQTPATNPPCSIAGLNPRPFPGGLNDPAFTDRILGKGNVYYATVDTAAFYVTDTIRFSKEWSVNFGARWDDFTRDQIGGTGANGLADPAAATAKVHANLFSWHGGILYKPSPISSFYLAYATSQSPIGSELDSNGAQYNGLSATLVNVPPQEAHSLEIGTKWLLFDKKLLATAAWFQTDVENARTNDNVTPTDPTNAFNGKYRVQGIELGAAGNITREWSVYGGLVLVDTEVLASSNAQDIGRRLANIPLVQLSLLQKYQLTDKLAIAGSATYAGEIYGGHLAANQFDNHTVDWWRFDAFAEYKLTSSIDLKVSVLNLTDELYYDAIYQAKDSFAFVAPGRAGYLTIRFRN